MNDLNEQYWIVLSRTPWRNLKFFFIFRILSNHMYLQLQNLEQMIFWFAFLNFFLCFLRLLLKAILSIIRKALDSAKKNWKTSKNIWKYRLYFFAYCFSHTEYALPFLKCLHSLALTNVSCGVVSSTILVLKPTHFFKMRIKISWTCIRKSSFFLFGFWLVSD